MAEKISHHGRWWMKEDDGTILLLNEESQLWDLWDIESAGPMPPPQFADAGHEAGTLGQPWFYSERFMGFAFRLFLGLGILMILTQSASSWYFFNVQAISMDRGSFDGGGLLDFYRTVGLVNGIVRAMWEFSVGLVVVAVGLAVHRYIRLRKLIDDLGVDPGKAR